MRVERDFFAREWVEQASICENTWCDACGEADIGLLDPREYEDEGQVFVEGVCAKCRGRIVTVIRESSAF